MRRTENISHIWALRNNVFKTSLSRVLHLRELRLFGRRLALEAPDPEADHGGVDEALRARQQLFVAAQASLERPPRERSLYHPAPRDHL